VEPIEGRTEKNVKNKQLKKTDIERESMGDIKYQHEYTT
jgi:hypothetical protein